MDQALFEKVKQTVALMERKLGMPECLYNNTYIELADLANEDLEWDIEIDEVALEAKCDKVLAEYAVLEDDLDCISSKKAIDTIMSDPKLKEAYRENPLLIFQIKEEIKQNLEQEKGQNKQGAKIISLESRRNKNK